MQNIRRSDPKATSLIVAGGKRRRATRVSHIDENRSGVTTPATHNRTATYLRFTLPSHFYHKVHVEITSVLNLYINTFDFPLLYFVLEVL